MRTGSMTLREWLHWRWTCITCSWLVIGWTCARRGHAWRTNPTGNLSLKDCGRCGKFGGWQHLDPPPRTLRGTESTRAALDWLVRLKDGPRDDAYYAAKDAAWERARRALRGPTPVRCRHCGDPIRLSQSGDWAHITGSGNVLYNCQHTVPYGARAEPEDIP